MKTEQKARQIEGAAFEVSPEREEFHALVGHTHALVSIELSSDLETPVSAFMKLRGTSPRGCFLLESAESGRMWGRYSFLGFAPSAVARLSAGSLDVELDTGETVSAGGDPLRALFQMVDGAEVFIADALGTLRPPLPFEGGAVGFFGYGTLAHIEKVKLEKEPGVAGIPDAAFMFPRRLVAFDHLRSRMRLCVLAELPDAERRAEVYAAALADLDDMKKRLEGTLEGDTGIRLGAARGEEGDDFDGVRSNMERGDFEEMAFKAREHVYAGDAFQVVVSQRFTMGFPGDALSIYRHLRAENPSPYMFYLQLPEVTLVGSSPEPMVTNLGGRAVIRPIAGTRPRGADAAADTELAAELADDPKEKAEHIMLVDLARNDLGRVSRPGSVKVTRLKDIERYSHVMHMVSQVEGELSAASGNLELLKASFPAGTVVGAPKVRASQIIEDLEPDGRGPYAGAVGYLGYSGSMDTCIAIRTVVVKDGRAHVQAGAGIVADSEPSREYEETLNKARVLVRAIRSAGGEEKVR